jgi:hypothetical protein
MEGTVMTTLKRNWGIMGILFIAALLLMPAIQAEAKTVKVKFRVVNYLAKGEWSPVGDVEGHVIGFFSRVGLVFFENGEVATYSNRGTFDSTKGHSSYVGYGLVTYEDGSTTTSKFQGTSTPIEGTKLKASKGTGEYIKGTGRFEGIKGTFSVTGRRLMPFSKKTGTRGDAYFDVTATYTLPSK